MPRALRHIETPATSATNNTAITITTISTGCIFSPISPPRPSAPEGADSRVMPIFIGYSHAPRFVLIGVASRRIRRPFCRAPVPASPKHFYRDLFCTFAYPLARRSAATTSLGATQICKKISTLKASVFDLLRLGVSECNFYLSACRNRTGCID